MDKDTITTNNGEPTSLSTAQPGVFLTAEPMAPQAAGAPEPRLAQPNPVTANQPVQSQPAKTVVNPDPVLDKQNQPPNTTKLIVTTALITTAIVSLVFAIIIALLNPGNGNGGGETSIYLNGGGNNGTSEIIDAVTQNNSVSKDTIRRNDMARMDTSLVQYQTNNTGDLPIGPSYWKGETIINCETTNTACAFIRDYLNTGTNSSKEIKNEFIDPDGSPYSLYITENYADNGDISPSFGNSNAELSRTENGYTIAGSSPFDEHIIIIVPGGECNNRQVVMSKRRHFAIMYMLEDKTIYCLDDQ